MTNRFARSTRFLCCSRFPALAADQVVLTNGDTITGAIVKKDGAKLTIKSEFLGEVTMPWSAVKSIQSDAELNVVLPGGQTVKGKLSTTGDQLQVAAGAETKTAPLAAVATVRDAAEQHSFERLEHPRILELWSGQFRYRARPGQRQCPQRFAHHRVHRRPPYARRADRAVLQPDLQYGAGRKREQHDRQRGPRRVEVQPQRLARACSSPASTIMNTTASRT